MASWYPAKALLQLLKQVDAKWPTRKKGADGTIGDQAHAARPSDHNPDADGCVRARDITHDPASGCDSYALAEALLASRDRRISYVISNGKIASGNAGPSPWKWRKYTGPNKHDHHCHISVTKVGKNDTTAWNLDGLPAKNSPVTAAATEAYIPPPPLLKKGSKGENVKKLQAWLGFKGKDIDGKFGDATDKALRERQKVLKVVVDGKCGPQIWGLINQKG